MIVAALGAAVHADAPATQAKPGTDASVIALFDGASSSLLTTSFAMPAINIQTLATISRGLSGAPR